MNRARLRRKLKNLIAEWGPAEATAEEIDMAYSEKYRELQQSKRAPPQAAGDAQQKKPRGGGSKGKGKAGSKKQEPSERGGQVEEENTFVLAYFVMDLTAHSMIMYLDLGFELDLYHHSEHLSVIWNLDLLYSFRIVNVKALFMNIAPSSSSKKKNKNNNHGNSRNGKGSRGHEEAEAEEEEEEERERSGTLSFVSEESLNECTVVEIGSMLCKALYRFLAGMVQSGCYRMPEFPFGSKQLRYEKRFGPFFQVQQPVPLTYEQFAQTSSFSKFSSEDLLNSAMEYFSVCKEGLEKLLADEQRVRGMRKAQRKTIQEMLKISSGNLVSVRLVKMLLTKEKMRQAALNPGEFRSKPILDFSHSRVLPIIKFKP